MFISIKYRRLWSDAAHHARRLIRAYDICSAIRSLFADDVTYSIRSKVLVRPIIILNQENLYISDRVLSRDYPVGNWRKEYTSNKHCLFPFDVWFLKVEVKFHEAAFMCGIRSASFIHKEHQICDVISEKGPYCGRNNVFLDQLFLHFCDSIFHWR